MRLLSERINKGTELSGRVMRRGAHGVAHRHGAVIHRAMFHARHVAHVHTRHRVRLGRTAALLRSLHGALVMAHALHRTHVHPAHFHATHVHAGHVVTHAHIHHG